MSDEEKTAADAGTGAAMASVPAEQPFSDEHTTEPNAPSPPAGPARPVSAKWQMPKPKFQQTSGYLPQGYLKDVEAMVGSKAALDSEDTTQEQASFVPPPAPETAQAGAVPAIEPQPDLSELVADEPPVAAPAINGNPAKSSGFPLIALGLAGILIFIAVFLIAVYFLFLAKPSAGSNF